MNLELTVNNKIEFLKEMIKELELQQGQQVAELPSIDTFLKDNNKVATVTDNKNWQPIYGPQWLLVQRVWGNTRRSKICFKCKPMYSENTMVKVINFTDYSYIATNMVKKLFNKNLSQYKRILDVLDEGLTGMYVYADVQIGKREDFSYCISDFEKVSDIVIE